MKKTALFLAVMILASAILSSSLAVDTLYQSGKISTVKHFRIFTPYSNDLTNGKPLIIFFAANEQGDINRVLWFVNKYRIYDDYDINLMCVSSAGTVSQAGWEVIAEELADYLKPEYEKQPFDIIIDCVGNGGYAGCCLAEALMDRKMTPRELNLGDGADAKLVTADWLKWFAGNGTQVNLYASGSAAAGISAGSRKVMEELDGTDRFHGETIGNIKSAEVLWRAISEHGLHSEYTCWDVMKLQRYKAQNGTVINYCAYIPEAENTAEKLPMLIYFHGIRDTMGKLRGLGQLLRTNQLKPNGIVILPQAVRGTVDADFHTKKYQDAVIELVYGIAGEYNGDTNRLSVAGHSDGGTTVYQIVNSHPGVFAACAPVSGVGNDGKGIRQTELWVFQGAKDSWVKPEIGLRTVLKCESAGCRARHYVYKDEGHEIQTRVFQDTFTDENGNKVRLIDWLMSKELN